MGHQSGMNRFLVVSSLILAASALPGERFPRTWEDFQKLDESSFEHLFDRYKTSFQKAFLDKNDELQHHDIFVKNVKAIFEFNTGKHSYVKGITHFTDLSDKERHSFVMPESPVLQREPQRSANAKDAVPKTLSNVGTSSTCDLRPFTTSVKNQGQCGSCWSFGTMAAAEASHFLWSQSIDVANRGLGDAWQLSEQVLINCCQTCNGCGGGGTWQPMQCAVEMGALSSTVSHPYLATDNSTCAHSKSEAGAYVQSWYQPCSSGDEACLKSYIGGDSCSQFYTVALKTSIEVVSSFYDYVDGVYSEPNCPNDIHNHAVAIVGWGTDSVSGKDYWIVRNSWGSSWGNNGYILVERGVNMCCIGCANLFFQ